MKVAIVHDYINKIGGAQNVLEILCQLFPEAPIYTLIYDEHATKGQFGDKNIITSPIQNLPSFLRKRPQLLISSLPKAIESFDFSPYDLVISSSNSFAHGVITGPNTVHISYCYSPMRFAWDWHAEYLAENSLNYGLGKYFAQKIMHEIRLWDFYASRRPDFYIAISQTVADRIKKYYRKDSQVVYPPTDINFWKPSDTRGENDYYYIISHLTPYKKIDLAISAFNRNGKKLYIAGEGKDFERLKHMIRSKDIKMLGAVNSNKALDLMQNCQALIFPGEDDFGLTPVEAMACGKPVIAYKKGGVTETVLDGKTGMFFDQISADSLNRALDKFEKIEKSISGANCRKRALAFSKDKFISDFSKAVDTLFKKYHHDTSSKN